MNGLIEGINRAAEVWWFFVLHAGWQSAVVGCALLAAVAWGRRWPSPVRYWLLVIALVKFAMPPLWSAPTGVFSHVTVAERITTFVGLAPDAMKRPLRPETDTMAISKEDSEEQPDARVEIAADVPMHVAETSNQRVFGTVAPRAGKDEPSGKIAFAATLPNVRSTPSTLNVEFRALTWKSLLLAIHVLGTIGILTWVAIQFRSVRRIIARSRSVVTGSVAESLRRVNGRLSLRRPARILLSPDASAPLAVGMLRPTVVLPESAERLSPREIDAVLVHELTHLRRGDAWLILVQVLLCALWWFHPVIWLVNRGLRRVREDCCDDVILLSGVATEREYCDTLLRVARDSATRHADLLACHMAHRLHPLGDRIRRIMDTRVRRSLRMPAAATVGVAVIAFLVLPGLGQQPSARQAATDGGANAILRKSKPTPSTVAIAARSRSDSMPTAGAAEDAKRFKGQLCLLQQHPVHISGRATNQEGKPVPGATVYVVQNNVYGLPNPVLGTCKTGAGGQYDLPGLALPVLELAPRPVPQPIEGKFQVVATAPGSGYTWRRSMIYRPKPRPATAEIGTTDTAAVYYEREPIQVDLHFAPEVRVHGRITNDWGEPLKDARVELGVIRNVQRGDSPNNQMWRCGYLASSPFAAEGSCNVVCFLPQSFLLARTDADGRYEIGGLPREADLIAEVEAGSDYIAHAFSLQTTAGSSGKQIAKVGSGGEFNFVFSAPREIRVRVTEERTGKPIAGVAVRGRGRSIQRFGTEAKTVSDGTAMLHLAPGKYTLIAEPPSAVPLVRAAKGVIVRQPRTQDVSIALESAAVALVKAVEAGTGKPVAGAAIFSEEEGVRGLARLQSQTVFIDNPVTDAGGNLRAWMPAGRRQFFAERDPNVVGADRPSSEWFDIAAGKQTVVLITLPHEQKKESSAQQSAVKLSAAQQAFQRVREQWHRQWLLCSRGRYRIRINNHLPGDVPRERLIELLQSCAGKNAEECLEILSATFPEYRNNLGRQELILDNDRTRVTRLSTNRANDGSWVGSDTYVYNGRETVDYSRDNAQVEIYGADNVNIGFTNASDLFTLPGESARMPRIVARGDQWKGTMTSEKDRLRFVIESATGNSRTGPVSIHKETVVVDEAMGFVYRQRMEFPANHDVKEDWQFRPQKQANGAVVPSLHFRFQYSNGKLARAQLVVIDNVEMMDRIPPETFAVAVPPGTYVRDYRGIPRAEMSSNFRPRSAVVTEPVSDVVARANEFSARKPPVLRAGGRAPRLEVAKWIAGKDAAAAPALGGKIVLVNFSAHWCGFCRGEWAQIEAASRHFANDDVLVVGIYDTADSETDVQKDIEKEKLTYRIALDNPGPRKRSFGGKTFQAYGIDAVPESAVIGRDGRIAYIGPLSQALAAVERLARAK